jgi:hypothetical protein
VETNLNILMLIFFFFFFGGGGGKWCVNSVEGMKRFSKHGLRINYKHRVDAFEKRNR